RSVHLLPPLRSPLFPYTTLFRSWGPAADAVAGHREVAPLARLLAIEVLARPLRQVGVAGALDHGEVEVAAEGGDMQACESRALRSEEHTSELQSRFDLVCRLLLV